MDEDQIVAVVDELVDALDVDDVAYEAKRLGLTVDALMGRVTVEVKARITGMAS